MGSYWWRTCSQTHILIMNALRGGRRRPGPAHACTSTVPTPVPTHCAAPARTAPQWGKTRGAGLRDAFAQPGRKTPATRELISAGLRSLSSPPFCCSQKWGEERLRRPPPSSSPIFPFKGSLGPLLHSYTEIDFRLFSGRRPDSVFGANGRMNHETTPPGEPAAAPSRHPIFPKTPSFRHEAQF